MRKFGLFIVVFVFVIFYNSCTKDKAKQPPDVDCLVINPAANTYNLKIKNILDNNCAMVVCHDAQFFQSNVILADYANSKIAFQSQKGLCSIKWEQGCFAMPNTGVKLADSLITYIECWANNGYPQ